MKKLLCTLLLVPIIIVVNIGCENIEPEELDDTTAKISDYFPFHKNRLMIYEGYGDEYAEQAIYFDYIKDNRMQLRTINPGTITISVLEYRDGELREIYSEEEFYHIENKINTNKEKNHIILKEPLRVGVNWTLPDGYKRTITGYDIETETPMGKYKALEVTTEYGNNKIQIDYYVKNIGHIARIYKSNNVETKTLLEDIKDDEAYTFKTKFYYPVINDTKIIFIEKEIKFKTNNRIEEIFENEFKSVNSKKIISPISPNTKIKNIKVNKNTNLVKIDFSKELIEEMKVKDTLEMQKIRSIVNTIGNYYGVSKVYISVEGKPYESNNFKLKKGEYFNVDDTSMDRLK